MKIELSIDTRDSENFCTWLNEQGHDATETNSTGTYIDGEWTSANDEAARIYRELWDEYSSQGNMYSTPDKTNYDAMYMNVATGEVDDYYGWAYTNEYGREVNAVDRGEVVEVVKNEAGQWEEVGQ
jgi:hypothetical protein